MPQASATDAPRHAGARVGSIVDRALGPKSTHTFNRDLTVCREGAWTSRTRCPECENRECRKGGGNQRRHDEHDEIEPPAIGLANLDAGQFGGVLVGMRVPVVLDHHFASW